MGDISEHFDRTEFACKCGCGQDTVDTELLDVLERIRGYYGEAVYINSGNRCKTYNKSIGGAPASRHIVSKAADISMLSIPVEDVYTMLSTRYSDKYGIGVYDSWVHIDVRPEPARWDKRT